MKLGGDHPRPAGRSDSGRFVHVHKWTAGGMYAEFEVEDQPRDDRVLVLVCACGTVWLRPLPDRLPRTYPGGHVRRGYVLERDEDGP